MSHSTTRAPDMLLREIQCKLPGSVFKYSGSGTPIVHYRGSRILWKARLGEYHVHTGHRDSVDQTLNRFKNETALLLHFDQAAKPQIKAPQCPYCGGSSELVSDEVIYGAGRSFGMIYRCSNVQHCDAYVGANDETKEPLGTLANASLREFRKRAHLVFDRMWKSMPGATRLMASVRRIYVAAPGLSHRRRRRKRLPLAHRAAAGSAATARAEAADHPRCVFAQRSARTQPGAVLISRLRYRANASTIAVTYPSYRLTAFGRLISTIESTSS